ncbi:Nuclear division defective protein 1 [Nakaseomyces bracarensis]|uniref:Nuclear division defective protein 1 n=1 Tax=Nakaseomyces bracarensis TaxID=273131 RepID=A0ABR4NTF6_9SACH
MEERTPDQWKKLDMDYREDLETHLMRAFDTLSPQTQMMLLPEAVSVFPTPYSGVQTSSADNSCASNAIHNNNNHNNSNANGAAGSSPFLINKVSKVRQEPSLDDINLQPSSVFGKCSNTNANVSNVNNGNTTSMRDGKNLVGGEFLLGSPEQVKEFLLDSPSFNMFNHSSAKKQTKTPLKYLNPNTGQPTSASQLNWDLLNSTSSAKYFYNSNNRTPLRRIDQNVLYFNNLPSSVSPFRGGEKKDPLTFSIGSNGLTPFGKKILHEFDSNTVASTNSALVDFQRARKDTLGTNIHSTPDVLSSARDTKKHYLMKTPNNFKSPSKKSKLGDIPNFAHDGDNKENDIYGSSPTTIQLNSSVTKSPLKIDNTRLNMVTSSQQKKLPVKRKQLRTAKQLEYNLDDKLLLFDKDNDLLPMDDEEETKLHLPASPTPIPHNAPKLTLDNGKGLIPIPELPKMGSFKSDTIATVPKVLNSVPNNTNKITKNKRKDTKTKKKGKKQPKFQIIVSNAHKFNVSKPNSSNTNAPIMTTSVSKKINLQRSQSTFTSQKPKKNGLPKSKSFTSTSTQKDK